MQSENEDIEIVVPREGTALSFDDMVIPATAQQTELAHRFINFILEPQVAAELTEYIYFLCPNEPSYALLSDEIREDPILFPPGVGEAGDVPGPGRGQREVPPSSGTRSGGE